MRAVFLTLFAIVISVMGYFMLREGAGCPADRTFRSEAECRLVPQFDAKFCKQAFEISRRKATVDYSPYATQTDCQLQFSVCQPHAVVVSGFVPVPSATCITREPGGEFAHGEANARPIYTRIGSGASQR